MRRPWADHGKLCRLGCASQGVLQPLPLWAQPAHCCVASNARDMTFRLSDRHASSTWLASGLSMSKTLCGCGL